MGTVRKTTVVSNAKRFILNCPISKLKPFEQNPRKHQNADLDKLAQSIKRHGFADPIEVNSNYLICVGHGRYLAAQKLAIQTVPVIVNPELDDREKFLSYNIANNKTAENSEWDLDGLYSNIKQLRTEFNFNDPGAIGFDDIDFSAIIGTEKQEGKTDPDEVPKDSDIKARCKPGELWGLGNHRLLCGDATKGKDVQRLMGGGEC
jgi:hypothetical protein